MTTETDLHQDEMIMMIEEVGVVDADLVEDVVFVHVVLVEEVHEDVDVDDQEATAPCVDGTITIFWTLRSTIIIDNMIECSALNVY